MIFFCSTVLSDTVELGQKSYTDVLISGVTKDKILFIQAGRVKTEKPLNEVTKLKIDLFPDFTRAEELAALNQYQKAMQQYLDAYTKVKSLKMTWQLTSEECLDNGQKILGETYAANAKSEWIKDLIKLRYAKTKSMESTGGQQASAIPQEAAQEPTDKPQTDAVKDETKTVNDNQICKECRGKGTVKCKKCNGSGKIKCTHKTITNGHDEYHAHYYEICPTCDGKGFIPEKYQVWIPERYVATKYVPGYYSKRTRKVACPNPQCRPYPKDPRIHIIWMCPLCATAKYPGYIDCPDCQNGRCTCPKCGGSGKITQETTPEQTNSRTTQP